MYDVIIIGAGPSGSTLASLLEKRRKVLIIDKRNLKQQTGFSRKKSCGGLLAPAAQKMLVSLGRSIPKSLLVEPQMFGVKVIDIDNELEALYPRHYINIDREKFDRWMFSFIPKTFELKTDTVFKRFIEKDDHIEVDFYEEGKLRRVKTRYLVGADGAMSKVRKTLYPKDSSVNDYMSYQQRFQREGNDAYYISLFDSSVTDFYSWVIPKNDEIIVGTAIPLGEDYDEAFEKLLKSMKNRGYKLQAVSRIKGMLIRRPRKMSQIMNHSDHVILIGEASGYISPSSAEGISYAMKSATKLSEDLNMNLENYAKAIKIKDRSIRINILYKRIKSLVMYTPWIRKVIIKSSVLSVEEVSVKDNTVLKTP